MESPPVNWDHSKKNTSLIDVLNFKSSLDIGDGSRGLINGLARILELADKGQWSPPVSQNIQLINHITTALIKTNRRYMELVLERVRKEKFVDLPSRYNCIFLSNKLDIEKWYPAISDNFTNNLQFIK